jgi:C-terminal tandem repeated domain in type 4 procollagen
LNLTPDYALDGWGNRFVYAVTASLTKGGAYFDLTKGTINVQDKYGSYSLTSDDDGNVVYLIQSAGPDGAGAYNSDGKLTPGKACDTSHSDRENCPDAKFAYTATRSNAKDQFGYFDDFLWYEINMIDVKKPPEGDKTRMAFHSQSTRPPGCPAGWAFERNGYSLLAFIGGYSSNNAPSLSDPGSCLEHFSPTLGIECKTEVSGTRGVCDYYTPEDWTYWLYAKPSDFADKGPVYSDSPAFMDNIAQCSVCTITKPKPIALHSQSATVVPTCPADMHVLWTGYSLLAFIGGYSSNNAPSLSDPGSCLEHFSPTLAFECKTEGGGTRGMCDYYTPEDWTYWLYANPSDFADKGPVYSDNPAFMDQISRCTVCGYD